MQCESLPKGKQAFKSSQQDATKSLQFGQKGANKHGVGCIYLNRNIGRKNTCLQAKAQWTDWISCIGNAPQPIGTDGGGAWIKTDQGVEVSQGA